VKPSGNSYLRIIRIRNNKGSFSSIEISNHFTLREHWSAIISRWYECSLHLYDIPTSHDVSNAALMVSTSCRIFEFWDFGRIASGPQAQMTMSLKLKLIIYPILIVGTQVMLVKLYFSW
jgi:hypothetical protein